MPSVQRGSVVRKGDGWQARWYDEAGVRRSRAGFVTKTAGREWLDTQVKEVAALQRGELLPQRDRPQTVDALLDVFLDKHGRTVDPTTKRKLDAQLRKARAEFGDRVPDSLRRIEL